MYRLIDTHAHLDEIEGLEQAMTEARSAGIIAIIAVGSGYKSNQETLDLAERYKDFVYPALGLHPWNLKDEDLNSNLKFIESNIDRLVGIGEVGLDYDKRVRARAEKEQQKHVIEEILKIAKAYSKPVIIHSRYAWRDSLDLVSQANLTKVVFHWYTGTSGVLRDIISRGYYISATPAVEYHEEHRRAVKEVPLERLLLETDSPVVYRGGTQYEFEARPVSILKALKATSKLRGMDENQIAEVTTTNALRLFSTKTR